MKILLLLFCISISHAQLINIDDYDKFKQQNKDMSVPQLLEMYPAGEFLSNINIGLDNVDFLASIQEYYKLTPDELALLNNNAFLVSGRFQHGTFFNAYQNIFINDLPNYISADLILQTIHYNFQYTLERIELIGIRNSWLKIINEMGIELHEFSKVLDSLEIGSIERNIYEKALNNAKDYVDINSSLFNGSSDTVGKVGIILNLIKKRQLASIQLFSETLVQVDFSQFTPRGFYTQSELASNFFEAMMWLGRTELVLSNGINNSERHSEKDLDIMLLQSVILSKSLSKVINDYVKADSAYIRLIGSQDNITPVQVLNTLDEMNINEITDLLDSNLRERFKEKLFELKSASTLYSSNLLTNLADNETAKKGSIFKLFGQRPIIDGFITSQTSYDRIEFEGKKQKRWIPSSLDISFSLGSNSSAQLLVPELNRYNYSTNLASCRYLLEQMPDSAWNSTIYNSWLNMLRALYLNDDIQREQLPKFAQTAAWHQKSLNTQLASWSQLRRNFILSAAQSYTNSIICSFPKTKVEPNVLFFERAIEYYNNLKKVTRSIDVSLDYYIDQSVSNLIKLKDIAFKQVKKIQLESDELEYLSRMLIPESHCSSYSMCSFRLYRGWLPELYFGVSQIEMDEPKTFENEYTVVDYHTTPSIEQELVGKVLHAGVGPVKLAFLIDEDEYGQKIAYVGAVFSYYEYISENFKRLNENEWKDFVLDNTGKFEPMPFTRYYSSDRNGNSYKSFTHFYLTEPSTKVDNSDEFKFSFYPNPVKDKLFITFYAEMIEQPYTFTLYDIIGNEIQRKVELVSNNSNFVINFDDLSKLINGVYLCKIEVGSKVYSFEFVKN